jgi:hypothetical protein
MTIATLQPRFQIRTGIKLIQQRVPKEGEAEYYTCYGSRWKKNHAGKSRRFDLARRGPGQVKPSVLR